VDQAQPAPETVSRYDTRLQSFQLHLATHIDDGWRTPITAETMR
jgi:hypothetical protein